MIVTIIIFALTVLVFGGYTIFALHISKRERTKFMNTMATRVALNAGQLSLANSFSDDDEEYMDFMEGEEERADNLRKLALITILVGACTVLSAILF